LDNLRELFRAAEGLLFRDPSEAKVILPERFMRVLADAEPQGRYNRVASASGGASGCWRSPAPAALFCQLFVGKIA